MWISAQSVTAYHRPGYCADQEEIAGGQHNITQEIINTFDNILTETVLANSIF